MNARTQQELRDLWSTALASEVERVSSVSPDWPTDRWRRAGRTTKAKPNGEDLTWWTEEGVRQLEQYTQWLSETNWKFVAHEGQPLIEADVSGHIDGIHVKGFVDAVMEDDAGNIVLVDYKTGSRTPAAMMQLGVYRVMLAKATGVDATHGSFWMTRKGEPTEPSPLGRYDERYVTRLFQQFDFAVSNEVFIPKEGSGCWSCDVRSACYVQGGVDAWKFDPDSPHYKGLQTQEPNKKGGK